MPLWSRGSADPCVGHWEHEWGRSPCSQVQGANAEGEAHSWVAWAEEGKDCADREQPEPGCRVISHLVAGWEQSQREHEQPQAWGRGRGQFSLRLQQGASLIRGYSILFAWDRHSVRRPTADCFFRQRRRRGTSQKLEIVQREGKSAGGWRPQQKGSRCLNAPAPAQSLSATEPEAPLCWQVSGPLAVGWAALDG